MKVAAVLVILFSAVCFADDVWKNELTVYSGVSFLSVDRQFDSCPVCEVVPFPIPVDFTTTESVSNSILIGFKFGHYLNENMEVEGNFSIAPTRDLRSQSGFFCPPGEVCPLADFFPPVYSVQENAITYYYDGDFVYNFHTGKVNPFFSAGIGGVSTDTTQGAQNDLALCFGGGAKFRFNHVGLRLELSDRVIPNYFLTDQTENDLQVQYGIQFGF